jgi:DnaD/phage-associated family protein
MHLIRRAGNAGVAWPSYQSVGDHCFTSVSDNPATRKSFARNAIDELIAAGLIAKESRTREDGGQSSNAYLIADPVPLSTPVPISTAHAYIDTPRAYQAPEDNTNEGIPIKKDDDDDRVRARGQVIKTYQDNIGVITPIVGEDLNDLIDEVGHLAVLEGIRIATQQNKRFFKYVRTCAVNHANGVEKPKPKGGDYPPQHRSTNRGYNAFADYLQEERIRNGLH